MTRKKVKLAFIENDTARKATYKKRKKGLLKKVDELTTLCGIDACAIIYGPYDPQPEVWPSPWGVQNVLSKFRTMPELEQSKKMLNQESFLKQRISKAKEQVKKLRKDNREKEMTLLMFQCLNAGKIVDNNMSVDDLNGLAWMIDQNLNEISRRLESGDNNDSVRQNQIMTTQSRAQLQMAPPPPPLPLPQPPTSFNNEEIAMMDHGHVGMAMNNNDMIQRQLFTDMMMNGGGGGHQMIPFGHDANLQHGFWPNTLP